MLASASRSTSLSDELKLGDESSESGREKSLIGVSST